MSWIEAFPCAMQVFLQQDLDRSVKATHMMTTSVCHVWDRSRTGLNTSSQLGTFLGESEEPEALVHGLPWTDKGGFSDALDHMVGLLSAFNRTLSNILSIYSTPLSNLSIAPMILCLMYAQISHTHGSSCTYKFLPPVLSFNPKL